MQIELTVKLTNDDGDVSEKRLQRTLTEYKDNESRLHEAKDWGTVVADMILSMLKAGV